MGLEIKFQTERPHMTIEGIKYLTETKPVGIAAFLWQHRGTYTPEERLIHKFGIKNAASLQVHISKIRTAFSPYGYAIKKDFEGYVLFEVKKK